MKQLKIMRIGTVYEQFVYQLSLNRLITEIKDYTSMFNEVAGQFFGISDAYTYYLNKIGYQAQEIFANVPFLQRKWSEENGYAYEHQNAVRKLPLIQAKNFKPDVVLINDFTIYDNNWIQELKDYCPSVKLVLSWCSTVIKDLQKLKGADIVLTSFPPLQKRFLENGIKCYLLRHAFDQRVLDHIKPINPKCKISFIGGFNASNHKKRIELINSLSKEFNIEIYSSDYSNNIKGWAKAYSAGVLRCFSSVIKNKEMIAKLPGIRKTLNWDSPYFYALMPQIRQKNKGDIYGMDMYNHLAATEITINCHTDEAIEKGYTGNMRLFEATGVGSCLLTDFLKNDISELFDTDREIVCYQSVEDCVDKIKYLLKNPQKRQEIAVAGQKRTLEEHTYVQRVKVLSDIIEREIT